MHHHKRYALLAWAVTAWLSMPAFAAEPDDAAVGGVLAYR